MTWLLDSHAEHGIRVCPSSLAFFSRPLSWQARVSIKEHYPHGVRSWTSKNWSVSFSCTRRQELQGFCEVHAVKATKESHNFVCVDRESSNVTSVGASMGCECHLFTETRLVLVVVLHLRPIACRIPEFICSGGGGGKWHPGRHPASITTLVIAPSWVAASSMSRWSPLPLIHRSPSTCFF